MRLACLYFSALLLFGQSAPQKLDHLAMEVWIRDQDAAQAQIQKRRAAEWESRELFRKLEEFRLAINECVTGLNANLHPLKPCRKANKAWDKLYASEGWPK